MAAGGVLWRCWSKLTACRRIAVCVALCAVHMHVRVRIAWRLRCCPMCAGLVAVDDAFSVPANRQLATNVSYNDEGRQKGISYNFAITSAITATTPEGNRTQLPSWAVAWSSEGKLAFNPASLKLGAGVVVAFTYAIQPWAYRSIRSNNASVAISVTDPVGPFPPPPSPPVGTGAACGWMHWMHAVQCTAPRGGHSCICGRCGSCAACLHASMLTPLAREPRLRLLTTVSPSACLAEHIHPSWQL